MKRTASTLDAIRNLSHPASAIGFLRRRPGQEAGTARAARAFLPFPAFLPSSPPSRSRSRSRRALRASRRRSGRPLAWAPSPPLLRPAGPSHKAQRDTGARHGPHGPERRPRRHALSPEPDRGPVAALPPLAPDSPLSRSGPAPARARACAAARSRPPRPSFPPPLRRGPALLSLASVSLRAPGWEPLSPFPRYPAPLPLCSPPLPAPAPGTMRRRQRPQPRQRPRRWLRWGWPELGW